jgi:hypothetical protein
LRVDTEIITPMKWVTAYLHTYSIFNIGTFYIRTVTVVTNICLSHTLYITHVSLCGATVNTAQIKLLVL